MASPQISDELRYQLLKAIEETPDISQRELAKLVGISLGKTNYCIKALISAGWVKAGNFAVSSNKVGYAYLLTPIGIKQKVIVTLRFLEKKQQQFEQLKDEIASLRREINSAQSKV